MFYRHKKEYDSSVGDFDIDKYIEYSEFIETGFLIISLYVVDRMIEPTQIKRN